MQSNDNESLSEFLARIQESRKGVVPKPMTPTLSYVLYNLADGRTDVSGALPAIRDALDEQCNRDWSQAHGGFYVLRVGEHPEDRLPGEVAINIRHTIPVNGAIAYHQVTAGVPDIEVGLDLTSDVIRGTDSASAVISHEVLETNGDRGANGWKTRTDGLTNDAEEACDFVQNTGYAMSSGVWVSNFLLPVVWIPGAPGPYDHMGKMRSQYDVSYGYGITCQIGNVQQIGASARAAAQPASRILMMGEVSGLARKRKAGPYSRTRRRGLVLAP